MFVTAEIKENEPKYKYVIGKQKRQIELVVTNVKKQNLANLHLNLRIIFVLKINLAEIIQPSIAKNESISPMEKIR